MKGLCCWALSKTCSRFLRNMAFHRMKEAILFTMWSTKKNLRLSKHPQRVCVWVLLPNLRRGECRIMITVRQKKGCGWGEDILIYIEIVQPISESSILIPLTPPPPTPNPYSNGNSQIYSFLFLPPMQPEGYRYQFLSRLTSLQLSPLGKNLHFVLIRSFHCSGFLV